MMLLSQKIKSYTQKAQPPKKSKPKSKKKKNVGDEEYPPPRSKSRKKRGRDYPGHTVNSRYSISNKNKEIYSESSSSSSSSSSDDSQHSSKHKNNKKKGSKHADSPQETLIQKPQINDPQLDKAMQQTLFDLVRQIRPKNGKRWGSEEQRIHLRQSMSNIFPQEVFPYRQELMYMPLKRRYIQTPNMPPSLDNPKNIILATPGELNLNLQHLPLRGFDIEGFINVQEEKEESRPANEDDEVQTVQLKESKSKKDKEWGVIMRIAQQQQKMSAESSPKQEGHPEKEVDMNILQTKAQ